MFTVIAVTSRGPDDGETGLSQTVLGRYESLLEANERAYKEVYRLLLSSDVSLLNGLGTGPIITSLLAREESPPPSGSFRAIEDLHRRVRRVEDPKRTSIHVIHEGKQL